MSHRKPRLTILAFLLAASTVAYADATTLICHMDDNTIVELEPTTIELDETQRTVAVHFAQNRYTVGPGELHRGWSSGPALATFGSDTITFPINVPDGSVRQGTINRITGGFVDKTINWRWTCQLGKKQF